MLAIWREYQAELGKKGVSDRAKQLELDVWRTMQMAPGVDTLPEEKIHLPQWNAFRRRRHFPQELDYSLIVYASAVRCLR